MLSCDFPLIINVFKPTFDRLFFPIASLSAEAKKYI